MTAAAPDSPPLRVPSRVSRRSPPFTFGASELWQLKHLSARTGRIFFSKNSIPSASAGGAALRSCAPAKAPRARSPRRGPTLPNVIRLLLNPTLWAGGRMPLPSLYTLGENLGFFSPQIRSLHRSRVLKGRDIGCAGGANLF